MVTFCSLWKTSKERDKQKCKTIYNIHYLKAIALVRFEIRKAELKENGKIGSYFYLYVFIFSLNESVYSLICTDIGQYFCLNLVKLQ